MSSISFVFRPSSKLGNFPGSLFLRIIHGRKVKTATIPGSIFRSEWDHRKQSIIYPANNSARAAYLEELDGRIRDTLQAAEEAIRSLEKQSHYTVEDIFSRCRIQKDDGRLRSYSEILARTLEDNGQYRTANSYRTVTRKMIGFNNGNDLPLSGISAALIRNFETFLRNSGKLPNTISFYMRNLRSIYNKAIKEKRIHLRRENPFADVFTGVRKTQKRALTIDELNRLYELNPGKQLKTLPKKSEEYERMDKLYFAWRLFFFCFHARGMCFVDMAYLKKSYIQNGIMRYYRKKTGQLIEVKVTREMQRIMDSFSVLVKHSEYIFPIITGSEENGRIQYETAMCIQNRRLKILAREAGIEKTLTTHVARHSWASIGKQQNLPLWVISEGLGHTSEKVTHSYLASFDHSVLDNANKLITKAIKQRETNRNIKENLPTFVSESVNKKPSDTY